MRAMGGGTVNARVRYLDPVWKGAPERPRIGSRESRHANTRPYDVEIGDARPLQEAGALDLDTNGFVLVCGPTAASDLHDDEVVRRTYYPEVEALLREHTGAHTVLPLQHQRRTETSKSFNEAYARYVHCDYSEAVATRLARRMLVEEGGYSASEAERCAFAWYNVWRPIDREVRQNPLTLLDSRTLDPGDLVEYAYTATGSDGVALALVHRPEHRFYWFPRMRTDEAILFKQLDSRPGRSRFCPHTSFHDPGAPAGAPGRRSLEVRMLCAFAP